MYIQPRHGPECDVGQLLALDHSVTKLEIGNRGTERMIDSPFGDSREKINVTLCRMGRLLCSLLQSNFVSSENS